MRLVRLLLRDPGLQRQRERLSFFTQVRERGTEADRILEQGQAPAIRLEVARDGPALCGTRVATEIANDVARSEAVIACVRRVVHPVERDGVDLGRVEPHADEHAGLVLVGKNRLERFPSVSPAACESTVALRVTEREFCDAERGGALELLDPLASFLDLADLAVAPGCETRI